MEGSNDECIRHAQEYARHHGLTTEGGFTNYVRREGLKTLGLELIEQAKQLGVAFDWYVQPVAGGIGLYSGRDVRPTAAKVPSAAQSVGWTVFQRLDFAPL